MKHNISEIWVFDYEAHPGEKFHNALKLPELEKRQKAKKKIQEKINILLKNPKNPKNNLEI